MSSLIYRQNTGELLIGGSLKLIATGYSGRGKGLNNAAWQGVKNYGPIPEAFYRIGKAEDPETHRGPLSFPLTPLPGSDMLGRAGFFIHGDNALCNHTASLGCIILDRAARVLVADYVGLVVNVVAGLRPVPGPLPYSASPTAPAASDEDADDLNAGELDTLGACS